MLEGSCLSNDKVAANDSSIYSSDNSSILGEGRSHVNLSNGHEKENVASSQDQKMPQITTEKDISDEVLSNGESKLQKDLELEVQDTSTLISGTIKEEEIKEEDVTSVADSLIDNRDNLNQTLNTQRLFLQNFRDSVRTINRSLNMKIRNIVTTRSSSEGDANKNEESSHSKLSNESLNKSRSEENLSVKSSTPVKEKQKSINISHDAVEGIGAKDSPFANVT